MFSLIRKFKLLLLHDHKKNKNNPCREKNQLKKQKNTNKISYKLQQEQQKQKFFQNNVDSIYHICCFFYTK